MVFLWIALGVVIGWGIDELKGMLSGAVAGYLLGSLWALRKRLKTLESGFSDLKDQVTRASVASEPPAVSAAPAPAGPRLPYEAPAEFPGDGSEGEVSPLEWSSVKQSPASFHASRTEEKALGRLAAMASRVRAGLESFARDAIDRYLLGGSLAVKVGVVVLFFGVAFLLKYASERELLPIEVRLAGAAAGGIALLGIGWRARAQRPTYGLVLQGGGVGVLYLTVFAALRLYGLVPAWLAFAILVGVAGLSALLAILQDSQSFAVLGVAGGFLAPVLTSTGGGSHVMLFSFFAVLNGSILAIAWKKAWRPLNLVGFLFTFALGSTWGYRYYQPQHFATTEPFLILFFLFYVVVSVLFTLRQPPHLKGYVNGTLVFGTPLITFSLQSLLVRSYAHGIALSSLALGLFYLGAAWLMFLRSPRSMRMLTEAFLAIGIAFGTLAIPLGLDNRWTAVAWALEGCGILWVGIRQNPLLARCSGILLQLGAGLAFLQDVKHAVTVTPVLNGPYLSCLVVGCAGLFSSYCLHLKRDVLGSWERYAGTALGIWGLAWWYWAGLNEISIHAPRSYNLGCVVLFLTVSSLAWDQLEKRLDWLLMAYPALGLLPALGAVSLFAALFASHPFARGGWAAWPAAVAAYYAILHGKEGFNERALRFLHAGSLWLMAFLVTWEAGWVMNRWVAGANTWTLAAWGLVPSVVVLLVLAWGPRLTWPVAKHWSAYMETGVGPIAVFAWAWVIGANMRSTGDPQPLSYLPILNPLDLTTFFVFYACCVWFLRLRRGLAETVREKLGRLAMLGFGASFFLWMNATLVRTLHFWGGIRFSSDAMFRSMLFQASLSILWSATALAVMVVSTRRRLRALWLAGAGLLAVVVVKLFAVDLSNTGTIGRIVSFIGVGILLLVVGYFSPVPPRKGKETKAS